MDDLAGIPDEPLLVDILDLTPIINPETVYASADDIVAWILEFARHLDRHPDMTREEGKPRMPATMKFPRGLTLALR